MFIFCGSHQYLSSANGPCTHVASTHVSICSTVDPLHITITSVFNSTRCHVKLMLFDLHLLLSDLFQVICKASCMHVTHTFSLRTIPRPTFVDYIKGGCQISLIVAVDFTVSDKLTWLCNPHDLAYHMHTVQVTSVMWYTN